MRDPDTPDWILLTDEPLNVESAASFVADEHAGAIDLFIGTTRRWTADRETHELTYEAYDSMAIAQMRTRLEDARSRFGVLRGAILHRTGTVPVGEASVIIAVSTPHRKQAFDACRFLIDSLKDDVPIWKRERYADGTSEWVDPRPDSSDGGASSR